MNNMQVTPPERPIGDAMTPPMNVDASNLKLTKWPSEPTLMQLKDDYLAAQTSGRDHIQKIKQWRDMRDVTGSHRPKKIPGRSSVQPKLIRRQNEWRYSALSEPFLGSEKMFDVEPVTWEDTASARQNEMVLNWQFRTKMNSVKFIDEYVRTDVDEGTVIVRVGWTRKTEKVMKKVPVLAYYAIETPEEQGMFEHALEMRDENPNEYLNLPEMVRYAVDYFDETQIPVVARDTGEIQEIEETVIKENQPTLMIVNPENLYIDPSCEGDMEKARFVIFSFETSKSELKKDGRYKNLDKVDFGSADILAQPDHVTQTPDSFNFKDEARKRIVAYEYWGLWDVKGDGNLVPIVGTWIGNTMIRMEMNPFPDEKPPFVVVPYLPIKRSVMGETDAELLGDNQAILGAITRGMIDLLARSANGQTGIAKGMLDPINKRRFDNGQNYEFNPNQNPNQNLLEHKFPELSQSSLTMLQLQNQEAEALTGVKSFSGGISGDAYGDVAAGIRGMLDAAAKREMAILRRLAQGMQEIGAKIVAMNQIFLSEEEVIRVTNEQFVKVRREDLKGRFDLTVDISTAEVDSAKAGDLAFMLQTTGPNMELGIMKMILGEIAELKRMPLLAKMIRDYQPQPDPLEQRMKEAEIRKAELEAEEVQSKIELNRAKARRELAQADQADLDFVEQETGTKHARDMDKQAAQARANQDLQITKALTTPRKEGDKPGNIAEAIGWNELSERDGPSSAGPLDTGIPSSGSDRTAGGYVQSPQQALAGRPFVGQEQTDPSQNIGSKYYDPKQDPALNPALTI